MSFMKLLHIYHYLWANINYWFIGSNPKSWINTWRKEAKNPFRFKFYLIDHTESIFQKPIDRKYRDSQAFNIFSFPFSARLKFNGKIIVFSLKWNWHLLYDRFSKFWNQDSEIQFNSNVNSKFIMHVYRWRHSSSIRFFVSILKINNMINLATLKYIFQIILAVHPLMVDIIRYFTRENKYYERQENIKKP